MADFNIMDHLSRMGGGFSGQTQVQGGDGLANEKESPEIIVEGAKKIPGHAAKILDAIPIIGPLLSALIPMNAGEVSAVSSFETQGLTGKMINPTKGGPQGGALYNAIFAPLIKNSTITDQTGGTGGDATGGGGGGFEGGGGFDGGGNFSDYSQMSFGGLIESGIASYEWSSISMASLGDLPPPPLPSTGEPSADMGLA